ncbi:MAG: hypothetical protein ACXAE3_17815, partial [Candidatus Kariarchaeaceae archaeon]
MAEDSNSTSKKLIDDEDNYTYIHVRIDQDTKTDLQAYAHKNSTSMTSVVTSLIEDLLYKRDDEEEDDEDELLDLIVTSLMNLERRMEIRLATLQDTFNSLIGRLIDSQQQIGTSKPSQLRKRSKGDDDETVEGVDFADVLEVDKEEEVYKRIRRFLQQQGTTVDLKTAVQQIEIDRSLKEWLEDQDKKAPGWKEALIADAIQ